MNKKQLLRLAENEAAIYLLKEIAREQKNLCHKTIYEQKHAKERMKSYAQEIIEMLAE